MARQLLNLDMAPERVKRLLNFLTAYVHFDKKEINIKFEEELKVLTNKTETLGITEMILDMAREQGLANGRLEKETAIEDISRNLIKEGLDLQLIHKTTSLSIDRLKKLKEELQVN